MKSLTKFLPRVAEVAHGWRTINHPLSALFEGINAEVAEVAHTLNTLTRARTHARAHARPGLYETCASCATCATLATRGAQ